MTENKPKKKVSCLLIGLIAVAVIASCSVLAKGFGIGGSDKKTTNTPAVVAQATDRSTRQPAATFTAGPTNTAAPTNTPAPPTPTRPPTYTPEPLQALRSAIIAALGDGNRDIPRVNDVRVEEDMIIVDFAINDNLFEDSLIRGAKRDIVDILEVVSKSGLEYGSVLVAGRFPMKDVYGNISEDQVIGVIYSSTTVEKINFDNFDIENIYTIRDGGFVVPAFNK